MGIELGDFSLERAGRAVEKVRDRLARAVARLEAAGVPYAVAGGHAVAAWVSRVDEVAVRNTRDVDILIRRDDFDRARDALAAGSLVYRHTSGLDMFHDGPGAKARDAVRVVYAGEYVREGEPAPSPDVSESVEADGFRVLDLGALVRSKLTAYRDKDRTHLRDLIEVGLVDDSWPARLPTALAERLHALLDTPGG